MAFYEAAYIPMYARRFLKLSLLAGRERKASVNKSGSVEPVRHHHYLEWFLLREWKRLVSRSKADRKKPSEESVIGGHPLKLTFKHRQYTCWKPRTIYFIGLNVLEQVREWDQLKEGTSNETFIKTKTAMKDRQIMRPRRYVESPGITLETVSV